MNRQQQCFFFVRPASPLLPRHVTKMLHAFEFSNGDEETIDSHRMLICLSGDEILSITRFNKITDSGRKSVSLNRMVISNLVGNVFVHTQQIMQHFIESYSKRRVNIEVNCKVVIRAQDRTVLLRLPKYDPIREM